MGVRLASFAAVLAIAGTARAEVDWAKGVIEAPAIGTADRRAPSPAVARVGALREAEERAALALLAEARALPWRSGTVGEAADASPEAAAALALAARPASLVDRGTEYLPDGSVRIRRALPIEAVRQAIDGPRVVEPDWGGKPAKTSLRDHIVDAREVAVIPAVGLVPGPVVIVTKPKKAAAKASALDAGVLRFDPAADAGALVVVVIREKG
jgi:hypothetical protein